MYISVRNLLSWFLWNHLCQWSWLKHSCCGHGFRLLRATPTICSYHVSWLVVSSPEPTLSQGVRGVGMRLWMFVGVARFSLCRVHMAHQGKQLSRVVTVILSTVVGFFSYVTVVEGFQHQYWNFIAGWFFETVIPLLYTGSICCYVLNKFDALSNEIYTL